MRVSIKAIITTFKQLNSVTATARKLNISKPTVYRWLKRGRRLYAPGYHWHGVKRHSTKPKHLHYRLTPVQISLVLSTQKRFHWGARKLTHHLGLPVNQRTVHRLLKTRGKTRDQTNYRRPLFQNGKSMRPTNTHELGYIQMDTKHVTPELSGLGYTVYEYAAIDILSRYKLAVLLPDINDESAALALEFFLKWFPFPVKYIQTDNGLEYQFSFQEACEKHSIDHYYIHKNSPNENAVIERSFRTDQEEFYFFLEKQPEYIGELNDWLQKFLITYNTVRPHQSLNYQTPLEVMKQHLVLE
jgi:transposase InsO family protein